MKLFYDFSLLAKVFVLVKPFQPSLMLAGKAGAFPSEASSRCSPLGQASDPQNIKLGCIGLPRTNALAYYRKCQLTAVKRFVKLTPGRVVGLSATPSTASASLCSAGCRSCASTCSGPLPEQHCPDTVSKISYIWCHDIR
jgi:hypothetical protein